MQRKEYSCGRIELAKRSVSSRMATTDKINRGLEIRRGKSLGLFTRSSLIGTLMRAGLETAKPGLKGRVAIHAGAALPIRVISKSWVRC